VVLVRLEPRLLFAMAEPAGVPAVEMVLTTGPDHLPNHLNKRRPGPSTTRSKW
jgi:hypothetical protein